MGAHRDVERAGAEARACGWMMAVRRMWNGRAESLTLDIQDGICNGHVAIHRRLDQQ